MKPDLLGRPSGEPGCGAHRAVIRATEIKAAHNLGHYEYGLGLGEASTNAGVGPNAKGYIGSCLLYTSDAADEL